MQRFSGCYTRFSKRIAFSVTRIIPPTSDRTDPISPVMPNSVVSRNSVLMPNANIIFSRTILAVFWDRLIIPASSGKRSWVSAASAVSSATSLAFQQAHSIPRPMAMPSSADFSAGASLIPSPTMATAPLPLACNSRITFTLYDQKHSHCSIRI